MKRLLFFAFLFFAVVTFSQQIYEPEGLNMPGSWNNWQNPPANNPVLGGVQVNGGTLLPVAGLGKRHYQTVFSTPTNVSAGTYQFLFTSGPTTNPWQNKWANVTVSMNIIQNYTYQGSTDNSITLSNNKYYVVNWEDNGYANTRAIFMELTAAPVNITQVEYSPQDPLPNQSVTVTVTTSQSPCTEEKIYVRYTTNNWASSSVVQVSFNGNVGTAQIPAQQSGITVSFYVFSTTITNFSNFSGNDIDLVTINFDNNNNQNYSYTVAQELTCAGAIGVIVADPIFPLEDGPVTITFDATLGNGALMGYTGDVYAHTGVITNLSSTPNEWRYVKTNWGQNTPETRFTRVGQDLYQLQIPNIRQYYGVPSNEVIKEIVMVIRSGEPISPQTPNEFIVARNADGSDMRLNVYQYGLAVKILSPPKNNPLVPLNSLVPVCAYSMAATNFELLIDGNQVYSTTEENILYGLSTSSYSPGMHMIVAHATDGNAHKYDTTYFYIRGPVVTENLPPNVVEGINYIDDNTVTLVLEDPAAAKNFVFVIGDFNNWRVNENYYMKRTPDGKHWWLTITGLQPGVEYAFQYYIDGDIKIADPYAEKILDPWNDRYIPAYNYPNLKQYPYEYTKGIVSVLQTAQQPYIWEVTNFVPQAVNETQPNLVIYELLIRDFVTSGAIKDATAKLDYLQKLRINAIELMPIQEFEGNLSWGYNPNFYLAFDKYYGRKNDLKNFIDECHKRGIAVIVDVVFNHAFGTCPLVQMYWDKQNNIPASNNPWFNQYAPHPYSPGYDFNHESPSTKKFVKRVLKFWLEEYKVDGFRFDLSKGFTQTYSGQDVGVWNQYDQSRVNILTDYYNYIKSINPNAYVILEHLGSNDEETALANAGFMLWGNMNTQFNQITMGWLDNSDISWALYTNRGFTYPNLIPYMESHDEERLMYRNLTWGNTIIRELPEALQRAAGIYTIYAAIPGPKMIWQFGELGYDYSINYCTNGTINSNCRTDPKPVRWDYYQDANRKNVYKVYSNMNKLRTTYSAFRPGQGTFSWDVNSGYGKRVWISSQNFNAVIAGNFGVTAFDMVLGFQHTGTWYNLFDQNSVNVTNTNMSWHFEPGDFVVLTDVYVPLELPTNDDDKVSSTANIFVYPNPTGRYLTINTSTPTVKVSIYDSRGRLILIEDLDRNIATLDLAPFPNGLYMVVVKTTEGVEIYKIVKK